MANNPTLAAMSDIFHQAEREAKPVKLGLVLSVGTGYPPSQPVKDIDVFLSSPLGMLSKGMMSGISNLLHLFVSQVTESDGQQVEIASAMCKQMNTAYFRFSPPLLSNYALDTTDRDDLLDVAYSTLKYLLREYEAVDRCARLLLAKKCCK